MLASTGENLLTGFVSKLNSLTVRLLNRFGYFENIHVRRDFGIHKNSNLFTIGAVVFSVNPGPSPVGGRWGSQFQEKNVVGCVDAPKAFVEATLVDGVIYKGAQNYWPQGVTSQLASQLKCLDIEIRSIRGNYDHDWLVPIYES